MQLDQVILFRIAYGREKPQFGDLYVPASPAAQQPYPVVILIHGGYWRARYDLTLMDGLARDLAARGYAAWNIEYRRVGDAGGGWPGTFHDIGRATDYARVLAARYNLDAGRIVAVGHSAGGHLACWLAARPQLPAQSILVSSDATHFEMQGEDNSPIALRGVISLAGVLDLKRAWELHLSNDAVVELLGKPFPEAPERYHDASPAALLPPGVPQVLLHGTQDAHVPIEMSRSYAKTAQAQHAPVEYIELEGADHFDLIDPRSSAWAVTIKALEQLL